MDKAILVPSVLLACLFIAFYLFRCWKWRIEVNNSVLISSVLNASGIVCGIALALSPFFPSVKSVLGGIDIYIFIGGIAVLFVSSQTIYREVIKGTSRKTVNKLNQSATSQSDAPI
tara:strand:+ start:914 stop:1261 length:348 start_codon:yes stop_codon:yes gene_type:complete